MHRGTMRLPRFPIFPLLFPLLFPLSVFLSLLGLTAWFSYRSYKELEALRRAEESRSTRS